MKEAKSRAKSKTGGGNASEFGAVTIDFNPAPDAEERLRRLFTLLFKHAAGEREAAPGKDSPADAQAKDGAALEPSASDAHAGDAL